MLKGEVFEFQAETKKLLDIIINSIYTNKEIFLRELVSNASDALDKVRFKLTQGEDVYQKDLPLEIQITTDNKNKVLTIKDTGIGMTKDEVITNLGTIAKSGTEEFIRQISSEKDKAENIIGRFGVGFYSVFMVAKEVEIKTRSFDPKAKPVLWKSDGMGSFEVEELNEDIGRGTEIKIYLKDDSTYFLGKEKLKSIIKTHSNFIAFPIYVDGEKVNTIPALWKEPKFKIKKEQYDEFYKFLTHDPEEPLDYLHISVDAPVQFSSIVFIPKKSTVVFETFTEEYGLDLYVNRVLIQKKNKDLIPNYLGFLKGVVDSSDLPLNLSREAIQENRVIQKINSLITKQVLKKLEDIAKNDKERYNVFWREHGKVFKLGYTDFQNREQFSKLIRFNSSRTKDEDGLISLDEYIENMKKDQEEIYYISGNDRKSIENSPYLEPFKEEEIEVLYLYEPIDEFILQAISEYKGKKFKAVEHADINKIKKDDKLRQGEDSKEIENLIKKIKEVLKDKVVDVRTTNRLIKTPVCLVSPDGNISSQMQKIIQLITKDTSIPKQILEINPESELIKDLSKIVSNESKDDFVEDIINHLYETALLQNGYVPDVNNLAKRSYKIIDKASKWYLKNLAG
ncbi:molecular chaperone HtpG [Desulfothermus okinawensis JCM 13304]